MEKSTYKNLKLFAASIGLATSLAFSSPVSVQAEEEILWENTQDDHHEEDINDYKPDNSTPAPETPAPATPAPTQITIDASNWYPKSEPDAGLEIPDTVQTEAERKGLTTPTPEPTPTPTPTPETPTPSPETPSPETPTPETPAPTPVAPQPIPKTGQNSKGVIFALLGTAAIGAIFLLSTTFKGYLNDEKSIDNLEEKADLVEQDETEEKKGISFKLKR